MKSTEKRIIMGMEIEYRFERDNEGYKITVFCAGNHEEVRFEDPDEDAEEMFGFIVEGGTLPGTVRYVLEDYCALKSFLSFSIDKKCCV